MKDAGKYQCFEGWRFFRWTGRGELVRTEELRRYAILVPSVPALSYDGKNWVKP